MRRYRSKTPDPAASPLPCPAPLLSVDVQSMEGGCHGSRTSSRVQSQGDQLSSATPLTEGTCSAAGVQPLLVCSLPDSSGGTRPLRAEGLSGPVPELDGVL